MTHRPSCSTICGRSTRPRSATRWSSWRPSGVPRASPAGRSSAPSRHAADRRHRPHRDDPRTRAAGGGRRPSCGRRRLDYYDLCRRRRPGPTIVVIEDLDPEPGFGAFWGEVNTAVHKGLGVLGCITNGSIRDLDMIATDFQLLAGMRRPEPRLGAGRGIRRSRSRCTAAGAPRRPDPCRPPWCGRHPGGRARRRCRWRSTCAPGARRRSSPRRASPASAIEKLRAAMAEADDIH